MARKLGSLILVLFLGFTAQAAAQIRDVEIFIDRHGREVMIDAQTGEVLVVREPRGGTSPYDYEAPYPRERSRRDGWNQYPAPREMPDYRDNRGYGGGQQRGYPNYEDDYVLEGPADDPWYQAPPVQQLPPPDVQYGRGYDDVERRPLDDPSMAARPDIRQPPLQQPDVIIEQQPPSALPDVTQSPQLGRTGATEEIAKIQILLDRAGVSPGVIDGRIGDNVNKAIAAYRDMTGETLRTYDADYIESQLAATGGDAFTTYEITAEDVTGPFVASIPSDYGEKARMERMSFTSVAEMLAERFHMDERYLRALNPGVMFERAGTRLKVANIGKPRSGAVAHIIADKGRKQVRAYDANRKLIAVYPATIGSTATPSPVGTHTVERIALNPEYTYNPKINFQQGNNTRVLTIPPGPNGPVGSVWIGLSKPTYGIHGTPEPSQIGKTNSNGCIRLTNWDAQELAKMVSKGVTVEFAE